MVAIIFFLVLGVGVVFADQVDENHSPDGALERSKQKRSLKNEIQLGPRPFFLVNNMEAGELKDKLTRCKKQNFRKTDFSIGHRGAPLQFPEHTRESYIAAAKMGAGILECDVTFTGDRELVCRHSQCDLHRTTNILSTPLASKCSMPFTPAEFDKSGNRIKPATAKCCTSDLLLTEFQSLKGKMDAENSSATSVDAYINATENWRTDLYSSSGTLMTHRESIALFNKLNVKMAPELKAPNVKMPFDGDYTQEIYARQMINEYIEAGVPAKNVFPQSFSRDDIREWITRTPSYGKQAVFLDGRFEDKLFNHKDPSTWVPTMDELVKSRVNIIAPPMWMLLDLNTEGDIVPSTYAKKAKASGLDIITWTLERSGFLENGGGWYYQTIKERVKRDGDVYKVLDVLVQKVGVLGVFSDWPATVSYYANCVKLK